MTPTTSVDGITPPATPRASAPAQQSTSGAIIAMGTVYSFYLLWCILLIVMLPHPDGLYQGLVPVGTVTSVVGAALIVLFGALAIKRVQTAKVPQQRRSMGLVRMSLILLPGLLLSGAVPLLIAREPVLRIDVVELARGGDLVAPTSLTFNLEHAVSVLDRMGLKPLKYEWDYDGDGKKNEETVIPTASAYYEKQGLYRVSVRVTLSDGTFRRLTRALPIQREVFSVTPLKPVLDEPVRFSLKHLVSQQNALKEVRWDLDGDGEVDEVRNTIEISHTYTRVGDVTVTAEVFYQNQSNAKLERTITIAEPDPLPFPVSIVTEPEFLTSPHPLVVLFFV